MRSFVNVLTAALLLATTMPMAAQSSQSQRLFNDALERERTLRNELESTGVTAAILPRARALVGAYEDMSRLFPTSGVSDNALWQGARLAADVFWQFGDAFDRSLALRLFNALKTRFPSSSLARQVAEQTKRLNDARPAPLAPSPESDAAKKKTDAAEVRNDALRLKADATVAARLKANPAARTRPDATPAVRSKTDMTTPARPVSSGVAALTAIRRDVLPEALRVTLELGREVNFANERIDGPPRVFIDLQNTRAIETLREAVIPFTDDVVKQIRVGQQLDQRTRVVMDLRDVGRYSVYTLYDPYRIIIDFERPPVGREVVAPRNTTAPRAPARATVADPKSQPAVTPRREAAVAAAVQARAAVLTTPAPGEATIAPTLVNTTAPTSVSAIAPPPVSPIAPLESAPAPNEVPVAPITLSATVVTPALPAPPPPAPPSTNRNGSFSLSRQLGLGIAKIVIDAGHGGHDPGAQARGLTEAELVLDVALRLEKLLEKTGAFEVVLTRRTNTYVSLEERTAIANRTGADLFLSIHSNASATATARGIETYFLNFAPNPEAEAVAARENAGESSRTMRSLPEIVRAIALNNKIDESRDFASMVQSSMYSHMRKSNAELRNLGVKQAPFMVLIGATMPSVLAEISFITNSKDAALLKTDKYRQQIAESLLSGVLRYQQSLKRVPAIATK